MSNSLYVVLDPFLELKYFLHGLTGDDQERVMQAFAAVQKEPRRPKGYTFRKTRVPGNYVIEIPLDHQHIAVTYEIWPVTQEIRISDVREVSDIKLALEWAAGLFGGIVPKKTND